MLSRQGVEGKYLNPPNSPLIKGASGSYAPQNDNELKVSVTPLPLGEGPGVRALGLSNLLTSTEKLYM
jgi:hypothetical protein